jgi:hypothetical protein
MKQITPTTLNEGIDILYSTLTPKDIEFIKTEDHSTIHFTAGMSLRNNWKLWDKKSPINKDIQARFNLSHGDDCSGLLYTGLWAKVRGLNVEDELNKCAKSYHEHWNDMGVDALTGEML